MSAANRANAWVRSIWAAPLVLGALFACAGGSESDGTSEPSPDAGHDSASPGSPVDQGDEDGGDVSTPKDGGTDDDSDASLNTRGGLKTCAAAANGHQAKSTFAWSRNNQTISFATLTTTVTNAKQLDGNYLTVSVGTKGKNDYVKQFESGPILTSGAAVSVPVPANFSIPEDKSLRIDHWFDDGDGPDLLAPCFMYF